MQTVGDYLKKERVARNISLNDVAEFTKISRIYLDCLEKDEYKKIPGEPYVKGYISSYAECVGISDHEALKLYDSFQAKKRDAEEIDAAVLEGNKGRRPFFSLKTKIWLVLALLIPIILTVGGYYTFLRKQEKAAADKRIQGADKTIRTNLSSKNESNFPPKRPAGDFFEPTRQEGFEKNTEVRESPKKYDEGIPPMPAPGESRPTEISNKAVPYPPVYDSSPVKELEDPGNYQKPLESELEVVEAAACSDLKGRTPQGCGESFEWSTDRVYIWNRIQCQNPPASIRHVYYFKGEKVNDIKLNVNSSYWRTWSYKTLSDEFYVGPWRVDITSEDGRLLKTVEFEIR
jgi:cytoskeletal protein RodZ